jgi:UDP-glucose 4-epimerase
MELLAQEAAAAAGVQPVIFRPPLVYGPDMKGNPLRLLRLVAARRPVPVSVPPARRSAIYVGNLAQAISLALRHPGIGARPYFVSDGEAPTTLEFIQAMANALRVRPRIVHVPRSLLHVMGRAGDAVSRIVPFPFTSYEVGRLTAGVEIESTRFWQAVGAAPQYSIGDGMAATAAWFRSTR